MSKKKDGFFIKRGSVRACKWQVFCLLVLLSVVLAGTIYAECTRDSREVIRAEGTFL